MTDRQLAKKNMYAKLLVFFALAANAAVWATFLKLVNLITQFVTLNTALDKAIKAQGLVTSGITKDKQDAFNDLVNQIVVFARKARVWAEDTSNATLEALFDVQRSSFAISGGQIALQKINSIFDELSLNILALAPYNVLPANITTITAAIAKYTPLAGTPGNARATKKAFTGQVSTLFNSMDTVLYKIDDLLISEYAITNEVMVDTYKGNRKIDEIVGGHNGLNVHTVDSILEDDVENVLVEILGTTKSFTTDINGEGEIIEVIANTYNIKATKDGYEPYTDKITIVKSNILHILIKMVKLTV